MNRVTLRTEDAAPGGSAQKASTRTVRVMSYNILAGGWPRLDALEAVIRDAAPDILGMQEVQRETVEALASRLGMYYAHASSAHAWWVGMLSRWPLQQVDTHPDSPLQNALLEAVIQPEGAQPLRVIATHLVANYAAWRGGEGARLREIRYILARMRVNASDGIEQLLMGDFNSLAPDERLRATNLLLHAAHNDMRREEGEELVGLPGVAKVLPRALHPLANGLLGLVRIPALARVCDGVASAYVPRAVVRQTRAAGYVDLYAVAHPDERQREGSCPSHDPAGRIDYIFASPELAPRMQTCDLLADTPTCPVARASDHRPILASFALPIAHA